MSRNTLVIMLTGGLVSEVFATNPDCAVVVLDHDVEGADGDQRRVIPWPDGAFVATRDHPCVQRLAPEVVEGIENAPTEDEVAAAEQRDEMAALVERMDTEPTLRARWTLDHRCRFDRYVDRGDYDRARAYFAAVTNGGDATLE